VNRLEIWERMCASGEITSRWTEPGAPLAPIG
jgi:hypothetical protein